MGSFRTFILLITVILAIITARYYIPVRLPGPMAHPLKYKIITASFAFILDLVSYIQNVVL
jgi:hypothetical protein